MSVTDDQLIETGQVVAVRDDHGWTAEYVDLDGSWAMHDHPLPNEQTALRRACVMWRDARRLPRQAERPTLARRIGWALGAVRRRGNKR